MSDLPQPFIALLNRRHLQARRARAARGALADARFLLEHSGQVLLSRFEDIKRDFDTLVVAGARDQQAWLTQLQDKARSQWLTRFDLTPALLQAGELCADEEALPFAHGSLDAFVSNLGLHSVNDLPGALVQIRRALKADGVFVASMLGGETLYELRESLMQAELKITGGASPRILPFADKPEMGNLLSRAGFALPVVDSDIVTVTYETMFKLMQDLRAMGETSVIANRALHGARRALFIEAAQHYQQHFADPDGRIRASFEIIYLIGWAPHSTQQQPLKPGSAQTRLADALGVREEKL